ncbi:MAG: hypothetical protein H6711_09645 [Myxococcales bacterium]|nr:hypothetical protein [Myxococcales bacterium]
MATSGDPWRSRPLRASPDDRHIVAAQQLLNAFERGGTLAPALQQAPRVEPRFGAARRRRRPGRGALSAAARADHRRAPRLPPRAGRRPRAGRGPRGLFAAEWALDGDAWDELLPADAYLTGNELWARHDRAAARAAAGDEQA